VDRDGVAAEVGDNRWLEFKDALLAPSPKDGEPDALRRWRWIGLILASLVALGVGLFRIGRPAPWVDEAVTVLVVRRPWSGLPPLLNGADAPMVPYYYLAKAWASVLAFLPTLTAVRTLSAVAAAITVGALFAFVSRRSGIGPAALAALILTTFPGFSRYAQEARPYALLIMTVTLAWLAWDRWPRPELAECLAPASWPKQLWRSAAYLLSLVGSVLFHLFGLFQWPAQLLADFTAEAERGRDRWRRVVVTGAAMAVAAVLVSVELVLAVTHGTGAPRLILMTAKQLVDDFVVVLTAEDSKVAVIVVLVLIGVALVTVLARVRVAKRYADLVRIGVIWAAVPLLLGIAAAVVRPALLRPRYWMPLVVPLAILAAVGVLVLGELVWRAVRPATRTAGVRTRLAAAAAALAMVVPLALQAAVSVPAQLAIRRAGGHSLSLNPTLTDLDAVLAASPGVLVATSPSTRSTVIWAARPELSKRDVLQRLDETGDSVWPIPRSNAEVAKLVQGHNEVVWVRAYIGYLKTPAPTAPPKALAALGFGIVAMQRSGSWWICDLQR